MSRWGGSVLWNSRCCCCCCSSSRPALRTWARRRRRREVGSRQTAMATSSSRGAGDFLTRAWSMQEQRGLRAAREEESGMQDKGENAQERRWQGERRRAERAAAGRKWAGERCAVRWWSGGCKKRMAGDAQHQPPAFATTRARSRGSETTAPISGALLQEKVYACIPAGLVSAWPSSVGQSGTCIYLRYLDARPKSRAGGRAAMSLCILEVALCLYYFIEDERFSSLHLLYLIPISQCSDSANIIISLHALGKSMGTLTHSPLLNTPFSDFRFRQKDTNIFTRGTSDIHI